MEFFRIRRKLLKFDSLHHYQYFILLFLSEKSWVDEFDPPFWQKNFPATENCFFDILKNEPWNPWKLASKEAELNSYLI